jgi:ubiquinone/menaquinone biosynthesis C-methylase UbiE
MNNIYKKENFKFTPELYDKQVNWENRFKSEKEFFKKLFEQYNIKSVLDVGCGTGRHAELFSSMVGKVYAIDPSKEMIEYAKSRVVVSDNVFLACGGFEDIARLKIGDVDAITCLGNTLSLLETRRNVKAALKTCYKKLPKNGVAVFQFINYEKSVMEKNRYYSPKVLSVDNKNYIFFRHFEYGKIKTKTDFIVTILNEKSEVELFDINQSLMCTLKKRIFVKMAQNSGFKKMEFIGNDGKTPFDKEKHISLFAILRK